MSNPLKSIGKTFRKVVKTVKKIALPALAIGAVVLTGGAALGVLPALGGAGGLLGMIGISGPLAGILTSAANAALYGAIGSALTGGSIIKGATMGLVAGGVMGGLGAAIGGPATGKIAQTAAQSAGSATSGLVPGAGDAAKAAATGGGLGGGSSSIASQGMGWLDGVGQTVASSAPPTVAPTVTTAAVPTSQGFLSRISSEPLVQAGLVQGLGKGLGGYMQAQSASKEAAKERAYQDAKWDGVNGFYEPMPQNNAAGLGAAYNSRIYGNQRLNYDPRTGQVTAAA